MPRKSGVVFVCLVLTIFIAAGNALADLKTATVQGISHEIMLREASTTMGGYPITFLFTTYDDNRYSMPYYYDSSAGMIYYSREMKKVGTSYKADYYSLVNSNTINDYGELFLNLGSIDSDGNGIDDICEKAKTFNKSVSGNWYSQGGTSGTITGTMSRSANSQQGNYDISINNTWAGNIPFSGIFHIGTLDGTVTYSHAGKTITLTHSVTFGQTYPEDQLNTTFEILSKDSVRILATGDFPTTIFTRSGNTYSATVVLTDGNTSTFWPDYQKWKIVIQDTNDSDTDGVPDLSDACPYDSNNDADGDGVCGDVDSCPTDQLKTSPGICGCGVTDSDSDGDGTADCIDLCPADPSKIAAGFCGCGVSDTDSDGDGTSNCIDLCPNDANKTAAGVCGCGVRDTDTDLDGIADCNDNCPADANPDQSDIDGDGSGDVCDLDEDNDGAPAAMEDAAPNSGDGNSDGIADSDQDNVASLLSAPGDRYITVDTITAGGGSALTGVSATDTAQFPADPGYELPYGLVGFQVLNPGNPGFSETVRIYFHGVVDLAGYVYREFDPNTSTWHTLPDVVFGVAEVGGALVAYADLLLTDGGNGDSDLIANGTIVGQGGPGVAVCVLIGDFDGDNDVDINDYNTFKKNWGWSGAAGSGHIADFDNDGDVDINDYNTFKKNWGRSCW